jgi:hypothetical protein
MLSDAGTLEGGGLGGLQTIHYFALGAEPISQPTQFSPVYVILFVI